MGVDGWNGGTALRNGSGLKETWRVWSEGGWHGTEGGSGFRESDPLIVNESEAQSLLARFEASGATSLALALHAALGVPVVVTRGRRGADVVERDGDSCTFRQ